MVVPFKLFDSTFGIKKKFPFANFMNYEIRKFQESGMLQLILERYDDLKQTRCYGQDSSNEEVVSLKYQKVIFPFVIIIGGFFLACVFLGLEAIFHCIHL